MRKFGSLKRINKINLKKVPDKPGVYGIFTESGKL